MKSPFGPSIFDKDDVLREIKAESSALTSQDINVLVQNCSKAKGLRRFVRGENIFLREVLDGIYQKGIMLVRGLYMSPKDPVADKFNFVEYDVENTVFDNGPVQQEFRDWFVNQEGLPPRVILEDDPLILKEIDNPKDGYVIVTDDKRLCAEARFDCVAVVRVPVIWYYRHLYWGTGNDFFEDIIKPLLPRVSKQWHYIVDTGSVMAGEEKYFLDGIMGSKRINGFDIETKWGKIRSSFQESEDYSAEPPFGFPSRYLYTSRQVGR